MIILLTNNGLNSSIAYIIFQYIDVQIYVSALARI